MENPYLNRGWFGDYHYFWKHPNVNKTSQPVGWSDLPCHQLGLEWCFCCVLEKKPWLFRTGLGVFFKYLVGNQLPPHPIKKKLFIFPICWRKRDKTCWNMLKPPRIKILTKKKGPTSLFLVGWHTADTGRRSTVRWNLVSGAETMPLPTCECIESKDDTLTTKS